MNMLESLLRNKGILGYSKNGLVFSVSKANRKECLGAESREHNS